MNADLVIFDLDGTLINSIGGIAHSANDVLEAYGYPTRTLDDYASFIGGGVRGTISGALPNGFDDPELLDEMVNKFKDHYSKNPLVATHLYPGIRDLLDMLTAKGVPIAVNTNKHASIAYPIIQALLKDWPLSGYLAPDGQIPLKSNPQAARALMEQVGARPEHTYYVGDSEVDIETARNAGVKSIWVSWGYRKPEALGDLEADLCVESPESLGHFIKNLAIV